MAQSQRRLSFASKGFVQEDQGNTCTLCNSQSAIVSKTQTWKDEKAQLVAKTFIVSSTNPVCQACRGDIRRLFHNPDHVPRWARKQSKIKWYIPGCNETSFTVTQIATEEDIGSALWIAITSPIPIPTPFCKHYYHTVYKTLQPIQSHCPACGSSLRSMSVRTCPDPGRIQEYLYKTTGFEGVIGNECSVLHMLQIAPTNTEKCEGHQY